MTIEAYLERIAVAVEKLAGISQEKRGPGRPPKAKTPEVEASVVRVTGDGSIISDSVVKPAEPAAPEAPSAKEYTADDVRAALIGYQKRATPDKARKLLKDIGGADTLRSLVPAKYAAVIEAAGAAE